MRNSEPLFPDNSDEFSFLNPSFLEDLLITELDADNPYALEYLSRKLNRAYEPEIDRKTFFLANGHMISGQKNRISKHKRVFYGALKSFAVLQTKGGAHSLVANLQDDNSNSRVMLVSGQEGKEPTLLPDYPRMVLSELDNRWLQISKEQAEIAGFLQTAALELPTEGPYTVDHNAQLEQIEDVLTYEYGLLPNDKMSVAGMNAYLSDGSVPITSDQLDGIDDTHTGLFLGLTFHDLNVSPSRVVTRLCIALALDDKKVATQPCYAIESVYLHQV